MTSSIKVRDAAQCKHDIVALGECMVRLNPPGHGRLEFARTLEVDVGGGEYNVAYACARLGLRGAFVSKLPDNPVARIILNHARTAGLDVSRVMLEKFDGVGRRSRVGLYFTGIRHRCASQHRDCMTADHSAISQMRPEEVDWKGVFEKEGARWLHTGGVMTALSDHSAAVVKTACQAARAAGTMVSYDLNYRGKLWSSEKAVAATREIAPHLDVLRAHRQRGGFSRRRWVLRSRARMRTLSQLPVEAYKQMVEQVVKTYPNIKAVGTTLREVKSGPGQQLGRHSVALRAGFTRRASSRIWRLRTASAAGTDFPAASPMGSSPA